MSVAWLDGNGLFYQRLATLLGSYFDIKVLDYRGQLARLRLVAELLPRSPPGRF